MPDPSEDRPQTKAPATSETTLADVKQLGLWAAIASLSYVFWICGGMEMIERKAESRARSSWPAICPRASPLLSGYRTQPLES